MVPCQTHVLLKWQEHFNSSWAAEDSVQTARRHGAAVLYTKLLNNKEVVTLAQPVHELVGPRLPDFECESSASAAKEEYLSSLLHSQRWLAHRMLTQTSYTLGLHQRLVVLQRIYYALHSKYHDKFHVQLHSQSTDNGTECGQLELASEPCLPGGASKVKSDPDSGAGLLAQVADFLKKTSVSSGTGGAGPDRSRRLRWSCCLGLAMQRGSLKFLLDGWR
ncbi:hypothetical protein KUCAC02_008848 [Chaenocephalus aceratus]|uniref:Uncharacterized protein n=1 Tax=Chaenocephalus aceratus TaxID=36190 RepID=A0ACB9WRG8_CHAAC|nr:hypothetical protein KUCAC02_008848 [Chaenocephalus aceratus]